MRDEISLVVQCRVGVREGKEDEGMKEMRMR